MRNSSDLRRSLSARVRVCALSAVAALLALAFSPGSARGLAGCSSGSVLYVVAHPDDSILFQDPDLRTDIASGRCVRTVFVTAGDAGLDDAYWRAREEGVKAAYADLAGRSNSWQEEDAAIAGHPAPLSTLTENRSVSIVFLRLPDGQSRGRGFGSTGMVSLKRLWHEAVPLMRAVDDSSTYSRSQLIDSLAYLMTSLAPDHVRTLDFQGTFGDGDHSDHHATAYFTRAASVRYLRPHRLIGYLGYGISLLPPNLSPAIAQAKQQTWFVYAPFDPRACPAVPACEQNDYASWWSRQYTTDSLDSVGTPPQPTPLASTWPTATASPPASSNEATQRAKRGNARRRCRQVPAAPRCQRFLRR